MKTVLSLSTILLTCIAFGGFFFIQDRSISSKAVDSSSYDIVFAQKKSRDADICLIRQDGSDFRKITDVVAADSGPSYSWDGQQIVFHSERKGWWKIWLMDAEGKHIRQLSNPPGSADYDPAFSPDGRWIAFTSGRTGTEDIFLHSVDGKELKNLTSRSGDQRYPRWLADGRIIYYSNEGGQQDIYLMDKEGKKVDKIDLGPGNNIMADVSSDGRLVFSSDRDGTTDLYMANIDGSGVKKLTESDLIDYRAKWSPDNSMIVFERSNRTSVSHIWILRLEDRKEFQVTKSGYNYGPSWKP